MPEARKFLTADERMRQLLRDRENLRRERMIREVAGPVWHRMVRVLPLSFEAQGRLVARVLLAPRESREAQGGYRVVTRERLGRELVGTVGPRADLFVLYEKVEGLGDEPSARPRPT